jgi:hypothetical protein
MKMNVHQQHIYVGEPDEDLIESLEPDQLVGVMHLPVARRHFSRRLSIGLAALRLFLLVVAGLVVYVFVAGIIKGGG